MNTRIRETDDEKRYGYNKGLTVKSKYSHQPRFKANGERVAKANGISITGYERKTPAERMNSNITTVATVKRMSKREATRRGY